MSSTTSQSAAEPDTATPTRTRTRTRIRTRTTSITSSAPLSVSATSLLVTSALPTDIQPTAAQSSAPSAAGVSQLTTGLAIGVTLLCLAVIVAFMFLCCGRGGRTQTYKPPTTHNSRKYTQRSLLPQHQPGANPSSWTPAAPHHVPNPRMRLNSIPTSLQTVYEIEQPPGDRKSYTSGGGDQSPQSNTFEATAHNAPGATGWRSSSTPPTPQGAGAAVTAFALSDIDARTPTRENHRLVMLSARPPDPPGWLEHTSHPVN